MKHQGKESLMLRFLLDPRLWWMPVVGWAMVVAVSLAWNLHTYERFAQEMAASRARFVHDLLEPELRKSGHGRTFATEGKGRPPPVTPAHAPMLFSEAHADASIAKSIEVRIAVPDATHPGYRADAWEADALQSFTQGVREHFTLTGAGDEGTARYIAPFPTGDSCLACHGGEGFKVGEIRAGLSLKLPMGELNTAKHLHVDNTAAVHVMAWLILSALTLLFLHRARDALVSLQAARVQQERLADESNARLDRVCSERDAAESRWQLFVESSTSGIYGIDRRGFVTFINATALHLLGYKSAGEVVGYEAHGLWHRSTQEDTERKGVHPLRDTLENGACVEKNETFWRADGTPFSVSYRAEPLLEAGEITGAVVVFDDLTEEKRKEQQLQKLSNAVEYSPESVVITNAKGEIEYVNRKFIETTGYSPDEVIGRKPSVLKSGLTRMEIYRELWDTISSGEVWQGALLNRKRNGELFWEEESISPIKDEKGRITHYVGVKEDITERRQLEEKIWRQANFDPLTDLPNRRLFYDRLQQAMARALREKRPLALMFIDLDQFKEINDSFGHTTGDELLRETARRLLRAVRRSDTVARMGGDEFTVILPAFDEQGEPVSVVAERLRLSLAETFVFEERPMTISASIGVVFFPQDGESMEVLLKNADTAMYRAKESGRNVVCYFSGEER